VSSLANSARHFANTKSNQVFAKEIEELLAAFAEWSTGGQLTCIAPSRNGGGD